MFSDSYKKILSFANFWSPKYIRKSKMFICVFYLFLCCNIRKGISNPLCYQKIRQLFAKTTATNRNKNPSFFTSFIIFSWKRDKWYKWFCQSLILCTKPWKNGKKCGFVTIKCSGSDVRYDTTTVVKFYLWEKKLKKKHLHVI